MIEIIKANIDQFTRKKFSLIIYYYNMKLKQYPILKTRTERTLEIKNRQQPIEINYCEPPRLISVQYYNRIGTDKENSKRGLATMVDREITAPPSIINPIFIDGRPCKTLSLNKLAYIILSGETKHLVHSEKIVLFIIRESWTRTIDVSGFLDLRVGLIFRVSVVINIYFFKNELSIVFLVSNCECVFLYKILMVSTVGNVDEFCLGLAMRSYEYVFRR